jgi:hypothetical protein
MSLRLWPCLEANAFHRLLPHRLRSRSALLQPLISARSSRSMLSLPIVVSRMSSAQLKTLSTPRHIKLAISQVAACRSTVGSTVASTQVSERRQTFGSSFASRVTHSMSSSICHCVVVKVTVSWLVGAVVKGFLFAFAWSLTESIIRSLWVWMVKHFDGPSADIYRYGRPEHIAHGFGANIICAEPIPVLSQQH